MVLRRGDRLWVAAAAATAASLMMGHPGTARNWNPDTLLLLEKTDSYPKFFKILSGFSGI